MTIPVKPKEQVTIEGAPAPFVVKGPAPSERMEVPERDPVSMMVGAGARITIGGNPYTLPNKSISKAELWRVKFKSEMPDMFKMWTDQDQDAGLRASMSFMDGTFIRKAAKLISEWDDNLDLDYIENTCTVDEILYAFLQIWAMINPFGSRNAHITMRILGMDSDVMREQTGSR